MKTQKIGLVELQWLSNRHYDPQSKIFGIFITTAEVCRTGLNIYHLAFSNYCLNISIPPAESSFVYRSVSTFSSFERFREEFCGSFNLLYVILSIPYTSEFANASSTFFFYSASFLAFISAFSLLAASAASMAALLFAFSISAMANAASPATTKMMPRQKYYVVFEGRERGIYDSWERCQPLVYRYKGVVFKSFDSLEVAENHMYEYVQKKYSVQVSRPPLIEDVTAKQDIKDTKYLMGGSQVVRAPPFSFSLPLRCLRVLNGRFTSREATPFLISLALRVPTSV
ncbi:hypothetical protein EJ110_NYTH44796 [Nymphaea thermarum]|nr:hypothetical protein EJ110_NYTH44796 [Nymphaea thermarum]